MQKAVPTPLPSTAQIAALSPVQIVDLLQTQAAMIETLNQQIERFTHQLDWFKRQLFGQKSERFVPTANPQQMHLGEALPIPEDLPESRKTVPAHTRRIPTRDLARDADAVPFFDEARVPVEIIAVPNPDTEGLSPEQFEVIGEKASFRLAQRPGSYVVLKYVRPVIKRRDTETISCPPAPAGVIEGSRADVSFLAGLLIDKFAYHLPLYRQHQRLTDAGITVSRPWLTQLAQQGAGLLTSGRCMASTMKCAFLTFPPAGPSISSRRWD